MVDSSHQLADSKCGGLIWLTECVCGQAKLTINTYLGAYSQRLYQVNAAPRTSDTN